MVDWLECCDYDQHGLSSKPSVVSLGKTLWHFSLLGGLGKQFWLYCRFTNNGLVTTNTLFLFSLSKLHCGYIN